MDRLVNHFEFAKKRLESTPCLVVDAATVRRNLQRLQDYARQHGLNVRPHTKTHKSREMARLQLQFGASGLTVAKVGEAEVMREECDDLLIAYPTVDAARCGRIARLAHTCTVRVAIDSQLAAERLAEAARSAGSTIGILVDQDVGFHRTGLGSSEAALELAQYVAQQSDALRLDGLFFYPGHVWQPAPQQQQPLEAINELVGETLSMWKQAGLEATIVSGGSTPTAFQSHYVTHQTEIRPGTSIYNDMNTVRGGFCELADCAAAIVATVVSTAVAGKAVIDAGTKTLTSDRNVTSPDSGHGHILEYPDARLVRLSEEHGEIDLSACSTKPALGERLTIIPNHICPCVNLQDQFFWQTDDGALAPSPVDTRGMLL